MAVLTALFHAPFNAVGVRWRCRDAWLVRPRKGITNEYALLFERTHGPCVPTCLLPANHKGQSSMLKVQSQGPYMRSIAFQSQPFHRVTSAILHANLTLIAR